MVTLTGLIVSMPELKTKDGKLSSLNLVFYLLIYFVNGDTHYTWTIGGGTKNVLGGAMYLVDGAQSAPLKHF